MKMRLLEEKAFVEWSVTRVMWLDESLIVSVQKFLGPNVLSQLYYLHERPRPTGMYVNAGELQTRS